LEKIVFKRYDLVIINRSFWPVYPVIGEALLRLAENISHSKKVAIVVQDHDNIRNHLKKNKRGLGIKFFPGKAFSNSSSSLIIRILDAIFFTFWVIFCILKTRPKNIYISTDPPLIVPFIVSIISKIMSIKYIYHLQDIHPEATNAIKKLNVYFLKFLKKIDNFTLRNAHLIITLNEDMKREIVDRSNIKNKIIIVENPSIDISNYSNLKKKKGFSFTGNLGRPQLVHLLIDSINAYEKKGGKLEFVFAGSGIYSQQILKLSKTNPLVTYHGLVSPIEAGSIVSKYEWALLPIDDEITRYSFPSKISSYVCSGAKILSICGENTSVARWIKAKKVGITINPKVDEIIKILFEIENNTIDNTFMEIDRKELSKFFQMEKFVRNIEDKIF
jgi:glycosyltransferase involved in cell wall biosynthesis